MAIDSKSNVGSFGENLVAEFLIKKNFIIKEKNYRKRFGEIDLIVQQKNLLAFVEVKTRKNNYFNLSEVIINSKKRKIILAAKEYISSKNLSDKIFRFDVALVIKNEFNEFVIKYIPNAFTEENNF